MPKATTPKRRPGRPKTESPAEPRARAYFYLSQAEFAKLKQLAEGCKGGVAEWIRAQIDKAEIKG